MDGWKNGQTFVAYAYLEDQIAEAQAKGHVITPKMIESLLWARVRYALKDVKDNLPLMMLNYTMKDVDYEALANAFGANRPN